MSAHQLSARTDLPRHRNVVGRSDARRELWIAAALFLAVLVADAAFIYAAAPTVSDLATSYAIVP